MMKGGGMGSSAFAFWYGASPMAGLGQVSPSFSPSLLFFLICVGVQLCVTLDGYGAKS